MPRVPLTHKSPTLKMVKKKAKQNSKKKTASAAKKSKRTGGESILERKKRARRIVRGLRKLHGDADCALRHKSAFQLLVSTILSAQSTDNAVNKVTPRLFRNYPTPKTLAAADPATVQEMIRTTGFFRQKTKSIQGASRLLVEEFRGKVPDTMEELTSLPGVARKTANVVLGTWFGKNEGVVVDTHVGRLAHRMGLTWSSKNDKDALRIEQDLQELVPRADWTYFSHAMIWHGRRICSARRPDCGACALTKDCPSAFQISPSPDDS